MNISFVFPCHNEAANIRELLGRADAFAQDVCERSELIIVNDGSTDQTRFAVEDFMTDHPNVRLINHESCRGYGGALISGFTGARHDYIFYTDGDLQFDVCELRPYLSWINEGTILSGYRQSRKDPFFRKINAGIFNLAVTACYRLAIRDIDCAFKVYPKSAVARMELISQGAMIDTEMLTKGRMLGLTIRQFPVTHYPRTCGVQTGAKPSVIFRAMKEFVVLWFKTAEWKKNLHAAARS